jgi:hypothetical protein
MSRDTRMKLATILVCAAVVIALDLLIALVFMLLWNALMPEIFSLPRLNFWKAFIAAWLLTFVGGIFRK